MPKSAPAPFPAHRISFQATAAPQDLRIVLTMPKPPRALASNCLWLEQGGIGGADFAPWETSGPGTTWAEPTGDGAYLYLFRVAGMSHRFVPHLAARLALCTAPDERLTSIELTGSAPITDRATSLVTNDVTPHLADLATYPGVWPDLGFEVMHVPAQKHELGFEIHLAEPVDPRGGAADALRGFQLPLRELAESFANERGKPVNLTVQRKKMMPIVVDKRVARHAFPLRGEARARPDGGDGAEPPRQAAPHGSPDRARARHCPSAAPVAALSRTTPSSRTAEALGS